MSPYCGIPPPTSLNSVQRLIKVVAGAGMVAAGHSAAAVSIRCEGDYYIYKGVTGANLGAPFFSKNWMETQHGGANKVANDIVE